ncbi:hypothetical protein [Neisseria sp.]|uniref:hypothetical protein n=1 Tax=Neisseria sp. TaxID=192066 RepID=UPI003916E4E3
MPPAFLGFSPKKGILLPLFDGGGVIEPLARKRAGARAAVARTVMQGGRQHDGNIDVAGEPHQIHVVHD